METMMNSLMAIINYPLYRALSISLIVLMSLCALFSIFVVIFQPGNSSGIEAIGGSSETFFSKNKGKTKESMFKKLTAVCLALIALFSIAFFIVNLIFQ